MNDTHPVIASLTRTYDLAAFIQHHRDDFEAGLDDLLAQFIDDDSDWPQELRVATSAAGFAGAPNSTNIAILLALALERLATQTPADRTATRRASTNQATPAGTPLTTHPDTP